MSATRTAIAGLLMQGLGASAASAPKAGIGVWAKGSEDFGDLPETDRNLWRETVANLDKLINDPDFCFREGFVVAVGRKTNT